MRNVSLIFCLFFLFISDVSAQRNVILIIADDLGSDYAGFYETHKDTVAMPNIRRLLKKGVRFRNTWSNPICSPTRAGLLTGRYSFRTGVGTALGGTGSAVLDTAEVTIPRLLNKYQPNGIAKGHIGKWHLQAPAPISNYLFPNKMGYDHYEGNFTGTLNSYTNWTKVKNGVASNITNYATTETTDNAISWIKAQNSKPFFLWLAYNAPHDPLHLPPLNLHSYTTLSGTASDIDANPKPYFKAMVEAMDHEIGRLFDTLQSLQLWENTDIIFIGDNGDEATVAQSSGTGGGSKGSIYQSGVSVPFIISGPSVVNPNRASDALVNTHDIFATILELFGYSNWKSQISSAKPVDSQSLTSIIKNQATDVRTWIFTEVFGSQNVASDGKAMRNKEYKLMSYDNGTQKLFNLAKDPNELTDLLKKSMTTTDKANYLSLCKDMTTLVGKGNFCTSTVGIEDEMPVAAAMRAFPNPFTATIQVSPLSGNEHFELYNTMGQRIFEGVEIDKKDFSFLANGIYFLKIMDKTTTVIKLVKVKTQ